jgi:UDP-hydrolysing UDP-N-acetyl-D-glucosamine 2-epimerase
VPWKPTSTPGELAIESMRAGMAMGKALDRLAPDVVLVVGDRVEAFAAASSASIGGRVVAHVHGGDRATGQVDDMLRHAITRLAHIHFPASRESALRLRRMGEDAFRIFPCGAPGVDGLSDDADPGIATALGIDGAFAVLLYHPESRDSVAEGHRARRILSATIRATGGRVVVIDPNTDPGADGVLRAWDEARSPRVLRLNHVERGGFLGLLKRASVLVGNSSAGIIESASLGLRVVDVGARQAGRERGANVIHADATGPTLIDAIEKSVAAGRFRGVGPYGRGGASRRIAETLASVSPDDRWRSKQIAY